MFCSGDQTILTGSEIHFTWLYWDRRRIRVLFCNFEFSKIFSALQKTSFCEKQNSISMPNAEVLNKLAVRHLQNALSVHSIDIDIKFNIEMYKLLLMITLCNVPHTLACPYHTPLQLFGSAQIDPVKLRMLASYESNKLTKQVFLSFSFSYQCF